MKLIIYILIFSTSTILLAQPTGENKFLSLELSFKDKANKVISFNLDSKSDTLYSNHNKNYKLISYTKKYFLSSRILLDCFYEQEYKLDSINYIDYYKLVLKDSIKSNKVLPFQLLDSTKISYKYFASSNRVGTEYFVPMNDLIIKFYNQDKLMTIYFEMYKIYKNYNIYPIDILFREGSFKVTNVKNPVLIEIKNE